MARIPNGNFSITLFQRWHKNYGEVYKCYKLKSFSQDSIIISFHFISSVQFIPEIQPLEGWGCGGGGAVYSLANKVLGYCVGKRRCWGNNNIFYYIRFLITNLRNR